MLLKYCKKLGKPKIYVSNIDDAQVEVEVEARQTQTKGINYTTRESSVAKFWYWTTYSTLEYIVID